MDFNELLNSINSLNDYNNVTCDFVNKHKNSKIEFNSKTTQTLNKFRSLEIEYYQKYQKNGIVFLTFKQMLCIPPSKIWSVLGKELICILQYWLNKLRKHLIYHELHWWPFLKSLLKFIEELKLKDPSLNNTLIELTGECLLDLITSSRVDLTQKHEIVHCFNQICANSSRKIRITMKQHFWSYFSQISRLISTCGHFPSQFHMLELLLRWLVRREDPSVRQEVVTFLFPTAWYGESAVQIFLERPWCSFLQDARDFLNAQNATNNLVTSVPFKKLTVGNTVVVSDNECRYNWLDLNSADGSISILLEPIRLKALLVDESSCEALTVTADKTLTIASRKEAAGVTLTVTTKSPFWLVPSHITVPSYKMIMTNFPRNFERLDTVLRDVFGDKYQDEDKGVPRNFGHRRCRPSGCMIKCNNPASTRSPSTVTTGSSIVQVSMANGVQLREKVNTLSRPTDPIEHQRVCAQPQLSAITEVTELESHNSDTSKLKDCNFYDTANNAEDNDAYLSNASDTDITRINLEKSPNRLLTATTGLAHNTVINDALGPLSKDEELSMLDVLVHEAFNIRNEEIADNGLNTREHVRTRNKEAVVENAPNTSAVINNSNTDDSNTIDETPIECITTRRDSVRTEKKDKIDFNVEQTAEAKIRENFSSKYLRKKMGSGLIIIPTLARKINETSSEENNESYHTLLNEDKIEHPPNINECVDQIVIVECMNSMVDKVCEFEKCTQYVNTVEEVVARENVQLQEVTTLKDKASEIPEYESSLSTEVVIKVSKVASNVKLRKGTKRQKGKLKLQPVTLLQQDIEDPITDKFNINDAKKTPKLDEKKGAVRKTKDNQRTLRRKRKLYSPKDGYSDVEERLVPSCETNNDDVTLTTCPNNKTSKESIGRRNRKYIRKQRQTMYQIDHLSPRTKTINDKFDKLREVKENNEEVKLADKKFSDNDLAVFNYTSESEDEDFKKKVVFKESNATNTKTIMSKHGRVINKVNYTEIENSSRDGKNKKKEPRRRKERNRKTNSRKKRNINLEPLPDLIDERMREAPREELNTSLIDEARPIQSEVQDEPEPIIRIPPVLQAIDSEDKCKSVEIQSKKQKRKNNRTNKSQALNKGKGATKKIKEIGCADSDGNESSLPGLIVESLVCQEEESSNSVSSVMLNKMKKILERRPNDIKENDSIQNVLSGVERNNYSPITDALQMPESFISRGTSPDIHRSMSNIIENYVNKSITHIEPIKSTNSMQKEIETNFLRILETEQVNQTSVEAKKKSNVPKIKSKMNTSVTVGSKSATKKANVEMNTREPRVMILPMQLFSNNQNNSLSVRSHENDYKQRTQQIYNKEITINDVQKNNDISVSSEKSAVVSEKSFGSKISSSTKIEEFRIGRKRTSSPESPIIKRRKQNVDNLRINSTSRSCLSSKDSNFLKENVSMNNNGGDLHASCIDMIQDIAEKCETTIEHIQESVVKSLNDQFKNVKAQLETAKAARREMYKKTATDMLRQIVGVVDAKFNELEEWSLHMERRVVERLKDFSVDMIRKNVITKRATVVIFKEDVEAVMEHLKKQGRDAV